MFLKAGADGGEIICIKEGHPQHGTHGRADHLGTVDVHGIPAHNDAGDARPLSRPENRAKIAWILDIFKQHQKNRGIFFPWLYKVVQRVCFLPCHRQHPLGSPGISHGLHHLFCYHLIGKCLKPLLIFLLPFKGRGHIERFHLRRRKFPAHPKSLRRIQTLFPSGLCLCLKVYHPFYLFI